MVIFGTSGVFLIVMVICAVVVVLVACVVVCGVCPVCWVCVCVRLSVCVCVAQHERKSHGKQKTKSFMILFPSTKCERFHVDQKWKTFA